MNLTRFILQSIFPSLTPLFRYKDHEVGLSEQDDDVVPPVTCSATLKSEPIDQRRMNGARSPKDLFCPGRYLAGARLNRRDVEFYVVNMCKTQFSLLGVFVHHSIILILNYK